MPLPDTDFDVTEVAVPWHVLTEAGHEVVFATERAGTVPAADQRLLDGVIFGALGAEPEPKRLYQELARSREFRETIAWEDVIAADHDALVLAGGHAPGMRQYLGSLMLRGKISDFWSLDRPVGAICHGVLLPARATDHKTGRKLLHGRRTTCLPKYMERSAYFLTAWKLGRYYRTYPAYVEAEVRGALASPDDFVRGPRTLSARGTATDDTAAFVVVDGRYVSARWPGDAYLFARRVRDLLDQT